MNNEELQKQIDDLKAVIKQNAILSDVVAKQIKMWQKICIITNCLWFALFVIISLCIFTYYYNTEEDVETVTETITQNSNLNNSIIKGSSNETIFMFNEDLGALNGKTNLHKNNY